MVTKPVVSSVSTAGGAQCAVLKRPGLVFQLPSSLSQALMSGPSPAPVENSA